MGIALKRKNKREKKMLLDPKGPGDSTGEKNVVRKQKKGEKKNQRSLTQRVLETAPAQKKNGDKNTRRPASNSTWFFEHATGVITCLQVAALGSQAQGSVLGDPHRQYLVLWTRDWGDSLFGGSRSWFSTSRFWP